MTIVLTKETSVHDTIIIQYNCPILASSTSSPRIAKSYIQHFTPAFVTLKLHSVLFLHPLFPAERSEAGTNKLKCRKNLHWVLT